jgi:nucleotide-binding universal stress UspA family protein
MQIKKILWPTDLSETSLKAGAHVREIAQKHQAETVLLYVGVDLRNYFPAYGGPGAEFIEDFENFECEQARKRLERLCRDKLDGCPLLHVEVATGDPATVILDYIRNKSVDMVVMASHGRGQDAYSAPPRFGSVADRVVKESPVPVLVVNWSET